MLVVASVSGLSVCDLFFCSCLYLNLRRYNLQVIFEGFLDIKHPKIQVSCQRCRGSFFLMFQLLAVFNLFLSMYGLAWPKKTHISYNIWYIVLLDGQKEKLLITRPKMYFTQKHNTTTSPNYANLPSNEKTSMSNLTWVMSWLKPVDHWQKKAMNRPRIGRTSITFDGIATYPHEGYNLYSHVWRYNCQLKQAILMGVVPPCSYGA